VAKLVTFRPLKRKCNYGLYTLKFSHYFEKISFKDSRPKTPLTYYQIPHDLACRFLFEKPFSFIERKIKSKDGTQLILWFKENEELKTFLQRLLLYPSVFVDMAKRIYGEQSSIAREFQYIEHILIDHLEVSLPLEHTYEYDGFPVVYRFWLLPTNDQDISHYVIHLEEGRKIYAYDKNQLLQKLDENRGKKVEYYKYITSEVKTEFIKNVINWALDLRVDFDIRYTE